MLYFTDQNLAPFYIMLCKIDIPQGLISDVNIDNPGKFCEASMSRSCISRKQAI